MGRSILLPAFLLCALAQAGDAPPTQQWPLWDGHESVADYAKRVNLPPTKTLDLGNGVKLELVLIPAGKFIMGTPKPEVPEHVAVGQTILVLSVGLALGLVVVILRRAISEQRPKFSLRWLLVLTFALSLALYGGVRSYKATLAGREYELAKKRYAAAEQREKPSLAVTLTLPFYMGKFDVTQEQYHQVMEINPSGFKGKDNPVERVSWDDAQAFCKMLTEKTNQEVRLPTEAEWEFACRAGTRTEYHSGDAEADLARVAWYLTNSNNTTHPVGQKEANAFGLYDMHGNVWQWCQDWYAEDYYGKSGAENPPGPPQGAFRLLRGGSWYNNPIDCRSAVRLGDDPDNRIYIFGFRVVVVPAFRTP